MTIQVTTGADIETLIRETGEAQAKPEEQKPPEAAEPADTESEETGTHPDDPKRFAKRMAEKHAAMKDAEEFAELQYKERRAAERRAEELENRLKTLESKAQPAPEEVKKPLPTDFKDAFEYAEALAKWSADEAIKAERKRQEDKTRQDEQERLNREFTERIQKAKAEIEDFDEVLSQADQIVPPHIQQLIVESDDGPRVAYHFARNPKELERVARLSPVRALAEIGKIEASFSGKVVTMTESPTVATEKPANVSKAPKPIEPISGSEAGNQKDPSQMSTKEYLAYAREQRKRQSEQPRKVHH
jgi:hypothetical protein